MNRQAGYIGIDRTSVSGTGGSGVWDLDAVYRARLSGNWSTEFSTFNYNYMGSSKWHTTGTWGTNNSTTLAQSGAGYPVYVFAISNTSQKGLDASWQLDFQFNTDGINSNPYPGQYLAITTSNTSTGINSSLQLNAGDRFIMLESSNNWNYGFAISDFNGSSIYSFNQSDSTYARGGHPHRVTFDFPTGVFTYYASTSTSTSNLVQRGQYTLSSSERTSILGASGRNRDYHIGVAGRGGNDGVRNVNWFTT